MHLTDGWDDTEWDAFLHSTKEVPKTGTAQQQKKHGQLEDVYNKRWQEIVNFGRWLTVDESQLAGWYHSIMTIGPEPKPIRTGMTLHSLWVTHGSLRTYKLFGRAYGGRSDEDLDIKHQNTATLQKWINLYDIMLDNFKGQQGHCVTMDSAYMGDIMA